MYARRSISGAAVAGAPLLFSSTAGERLLFSAALARRRISTVAGPLHFSVALVGTIISVAQNRCWTSDRVMTYRKRLATPSDRVWLSELAPIGFMHLMPILGEGIVKWWTEIISPSHWSNKKRFELPNHPDNVEAMENVERLCCETKYAASPQHSSSGKD